MWSVSVCMVGEGAIFYLTVYKKMYDIATDSLNSLQRHLYIFINFVLQIADHVLTPIVFKLQLSISSYFVK